MTSEEDMGVQRSKTDRTFVVLGGVGNGKSALCNLLYGQRYFFLPYKFKCHQGNSPNSKTLVMQKEISYIEQQSIQEYIPFNGVKYLYFDIFDKSGIGDANIHLKSHTDNLKECYLNSDTCMNITFLIVVSLVDTELFNEYLPILNSILAFMKSDSYNISGNAMLVCTKKDLYMQKHGIRTDHQLEDQFHEDLESPEWVQLKNLLKHVEERKVFVNCTDYSGRREVLYSALKMCAPKLTIMVHGNKLFPGEKVLRKLVEGKENIYEYKITLKLAHDFDFSLRKQDEMFQGEEDKSEEIRTMRNLVDGISVITILISLQHHYTKGMDKFIRRLSFLYGLNGSRDWWKFIIIVFLIPEGCSNASAELQIYENPALSDIVTRIKRRYVLATESTNGKRLMDNVLQMCFEVKRENKGKDFIDENINKKIIDKGLKELYDKQREKLQNVRYINCEIDEKEVYIPGLLTCKSVRVPNHVVSSRIENYELVNAIYKYLILKDRMDPIAQEIKDNYIELDDLFFCELYNKTDCI